MQNKPTCAQSPVCSVKKKEASTHSDSYHYFRVTKMKLNYFLINICAVVSVNDINSLQSDQFTFSTSGSCHSGAANNTTVERHIEVILTQLRKWPKFGKTSS